MREMSTTSSGYLGRSRLAPHSVRLTRHLAACFPVAILICNQGVRGSSPLRGTAQIKDLRAAIRKFRTARVPIKSASADRCASVPRVPTAQHHLSAAQNRAAQLHRTLGITLKSAWFLSHRIREAMKDTGTIFGVCGDVTTEPASCQGSDNSPSRETGAALLFYGQRG